jgi:hypothetical protein
MPPKKSSQTPVKRPASTSPSLTPPPATKTTKSPKRAIKAEPVPELVGDAPTPAKKPRVSATKGKAKIKAEAEEKLSDIDDIVDKKPEITPVKRARTKKVKAEEGEEKPDIDIEKKDVDTPKKPARGKKVKSEVEDGGEEGGEPAAKKPRQAKSRVFPPADLDVSLHPPRAGHPIHTLPPLSVSFNGGLLTPATSITRPHLLGAHTSIGGGPATALYRAGLAGANALALFLKSQRQWKSNPYEPEAVERFREQMKGKDEGGLGYGPESILVHGSYLINLGCVPYDRSECSADIIVETQIREGSQSCCPAQLMNIQDQVEDIIRLLQGRYLQMSSAWDSALQLAVGGPPQAFHNTY